ncbi:MAG: porin [Betaproteobacteria bacterium]|nr:porin [Betaproteobacteria bacterium]
MKKSLLALAALTAFAGVASAQSSVTLFGIVDAAARNTKNGNAGTIKSLISGGGNTSRLGFRGIEDLGGGMRAGFWLEGQVDTDTGGTGFNFARRATVSLIGGFGELRLGRDFVPTYSNWGAAEIFGYVGVATTANLRAGFLGQGSIATAVRTNNQIMYFLPAMGGLYGSINVGAGEGTGDKYVGGRLGYAAGPFNVGGAYGKSERGAGEIETMSVTGSFNMGFATLLAGYENSEYTSGATSNDIDLITVAMTMPLGKGTLKAQYTKADSSSANFDATMFGVGYVYNLSKRTSLYTSYGSIDNGGNKTAGGNYTAGSAGPAGMFRGEKSTGYEFGITHTF